DRTHAIGLSPGYGLAWAARGNAYFIMGRWDDALSALTQAARVEPNNEETHRLREMAQTQVDEIVADAKAKEKAPETVKVELPGGEAAATAPQPAAPQP